jgi:hypothetical protein
MERVTLSIMLRALALTALVAALTGVVFAAGLMAHAEAAGYSNKRKELRFLILKTQQ